MGDISPNFSRHEFKCPCCNFDSIDAETLVVLEAIRQRFGPVAVISGARCKEYNERIGGSRNSQHMYARAADITVEGADPAEIQEWLDNTWPDTYGIGYYSTFTHIDTRKNRARWVG